MHPNEFNSVSFWYFNKSNHSNEEVNKENDNDKNEVEQNEDNNKFEQQTGDTDNNNCIRWITVNPFVFCRGKKVEKWVIDFYKNTDWGLMTRQHIKCK